MTVAGGIFDANMARTMNSNMENGSSTMWVVMRYTTKISDSGYRRIKMAL